MSEVENHYATDKGGPRGGSARPGTSGGAIGRAGETATQALRSAAETAGRTLSGVRDSASDATEWASDRYDTVSRTVGQARRRSAAEIERGRRNVEHLIEENPIMIGVAGLAAGLLLGALLPRTRSEDRYLGRYADEVKAQGMRYAQDVAAQGRQLVQENLDRLQQGAVDRDTGDETSAER